ncbi:MAG: DUF177 domain-containing protein [Candidatus Tectomicrobia bacterium]|nr:DUF177 domain-containing protein [Candidatus Tectomicrobia bacterium]
MTPPQLGHALVIDLAKIPVHGLTLDTEVMPAVPQDDLTLTMPVRVQGLLTRVMEQVYFQGNICGTVAVPCSRCLDTVHDTFEADLRIVFFPVGAYGTSDETAQERFTDDLDLYLHDGMRLDLNPVVHEHVVMALPVQTLCREDCVGLCQVCGINRNEQSCACQLESEDPRFSILKRLTIPESS